MEMERHIILQCVPVQVSICKDGYGVLHETVYKDTMILAPYDGELIVIEN